MEEDLGICYLSEDEEAVYASFSHFCILGTQRISETVI